MADAGSSGNWLLIEELFERGDPSFVESLRSFHDPDALGGFARRWISDRRSVARGFLLDYLDGDLNAFRHEALFKRLFKAAEKAGDDELMAAFLVALDRSVRRTRVKMRRTRQAVADSLEALRVIVETWKREGAESVNHWHHGKQYHIWGTWIETVLRSPRGRTMPRGASVTVFAPSDWRRLKPITVPDWLVRPRIKFDGTWTDRPPSPEELGKLRKFRLFSTATRNYLRRRAWRYFRRLAKERPSDYVRAVSIALSRYRDEDVSDGLALIDNWGLVHILFHRTPVLVALTSGWWVVHGRTLAELEPAPFREDLWKSEPKALLDLLLSARSRPVREWAIRFFNREVTASEPLSLETWLGLLASDVEEVVSFAADRIRNAPGLDRVSVDRWLTMLDSENDAATAIVSELIGLHVRADRVTLEEAVKLAMRRPPAIASLGLKMLDGKRPSTDEELGWIRGLVATECASLRPQIVRRVRAILGESPRFDNGWVMDFLDSRFDDARKEGWDWFSADERLSEDVELWRKLLESPYDDIRAGLVERLRRRVGEANVGESLEAELDPRALRRLWATVLLNDRRGADAKPGVVSMIARRVERRPTEARDLLPILGVALRSIRGPERRAGLAAVARLVDRVPSVEATVVGMIPELRLF